MCEDHTGQNQSSVQPPTPIQCWRNKPHGVDVVTIIIIHHIEDVQLDQYFIYSRAYNKLKLFWGGHAGSYFSMDNGRIINLALVSKWTWTSQKERRTNKKDIWCLSTKKWLNGEPVSSQRLVWDKGQAVVSSCSFSSWWGADVVWNIDFTTWSKQIIIIVFRMFQEIHVL